ncbi:MAG: SPOR domain-containing protein [Kordiimonadaceae bacterium]|nr:SPOR domain-containing protein [Kordiimonadaceae bacterium]MBT6036247.1 SPOR domain-containing protein [Kordiimonadaceae bacterium]MBT6329730.1 SPOR domain-containing protein [Kordiimonadaceae bacterium]MBT7582295.1 SPOR domain-containing protein [Kordiimonadaceae bacterium]
MTKKNVDNASWLRPLPEEFANNKGITSKRRLILSSITFTVLAGFSALVWMSYTSENTPMGPIPVVRADNSVVKEKPDDPGGKEILFQDKEIFDRVDNMATEKEDVIAPSSEIPLKRPVPEVTEEQVQVAAEKAEEIIPAAAPVKQAVVTKGDFMIQIAAIGDKSKAEAIWADVKKKNSSALSKLAPTYMAVDLGDKGVLYRVRGGMLETRKAADDVCAKLKSNNQNCLVVIK